MRKTALLLAILLYASTSFASCLNQTQLDLLNQIADDYNMTNQTKQVWLGIFDSLCQQNEINQLQNNTYTKNETNQMMHNLTLKIANVSSQIEFLNASVDTRFDPIFRIWKNDTLEDINRTIEQYELTVDRRFENIREDYATKNELDNITQQLEILEGDLNYKLQLVKDKSSNYGVYSILFTLVVAVLLYWQISQLRKTPKYNQTIRKEIEDLVADENVKKKVNYIKQLRNLVLKLKLPIEKKVQLFRAIDMGYIKSEEDVEKFAGGDKHGKKRNTNRSRRKNKKRD